MKRKRGPKFNLGPLFSKKRNDEVDAVENTDYPIISQKNETMTAKGVDYIRLHKKMEAGYPQKKGKPSNKNGFHKKIKTAFILKPKQPFFSLLKVL